MSFSAKTSVIGNQMPAIGTMRIIDVSVLQRDRAASSLGFGPSPSSSGPPNRDHADSTRSFASTNFCQKPTHTFCARFFYRSWRRPHRWMCCSARPRTPRRDNALSQAHDEVGKLGVGARPSCSDRFVRRGCPCRQETSHDRSGRSVTPKSPLPIPHCFPMREGHAQVRLRPVHSSQINETWTQKLHKEHSNWRAGPLLPQGGRSCSSVASRCVRIGNFPDKETHGRAFLLLWVSHHVPSRCVAGCYKVRRYDGLLSRPKKPDRV